MALFKEENEINGVELPYKKITHISATKNNADVVIGFSVGSKFNPMSSKTVALTKEENSELGDILVKEAYKYLKSKGKITGEDC